MTKTQTAPTECRRCHRVLTDAKRIARGIGRTCERRERQDAAVAGFKPAQVAKAHELIEQGGILPLRGKRVFKVVSSEGDKRYLTAPQACSCAAGVKGKYACYHRIAAVLLAA